MVPFYQLAKEWSEVTSCITVGMVSSYNHVILVYFLLENIKLSDKGILWKYSIQKMKALRGFIESVHAR